MTSRWFDGYDWKARCGTYSGYVRHRRIGEDACVACKDAAAAYKRRYRGGRKAIDSLAVECWCKATIVRVPRSTVLACRTGSCGSAACTDPEAVA